MFFSDSIAIQVNTVLHTLYFGKYFLILNAYIKIANYIISVNV